MVNFSVIVNPFNRGFSLSDRVSYRYMSVVRL